VSAGAIVYISSRSAEACEKVAKELHERGPGQCYAIPADLSKMEEVTRLVGELSQRIDRKSHQKSKIIKIIIKHKC
jgi:short-subunit dehydrogenase